MLADVLLVETKSSNSIETSNDKRIKGQYFTLTSPFAHTAFTEWASLFPASTTILEPYSGANNLIWMLQAKGLAYSYAAFDLEPQEESVVQRDTINDFPTGYKVCVTNPPYLAKNSATRRGIKMPDLGEYDNLWKLATARCLDNCDYVAAIIPESFITSGLFRDRLYAVVSLTTRMFDDTDQPVCLALWVPEATSDFRVWHGDTGLGYYSALQETISQLLPVNETLSDTKIIFNDPAGSLGLIATDSTSGPGIKFVRGDTIPADSIKVSSRHSTRITINNAVGDLDSLIATLNQLVEKYRKASHDVFLTSFRGIRHDGKFRRRIDWDTARSIILAGLSAHFRPDEN